MAEIIYLGLGTNVGDRAANLCSTLRALRDIVDIEALSAVYESDAIGHVDQPRFWNMAIRAVSGLSPHSMLERLQRLERDIGRVPTFRMGPRVIDIDVLLYGLRVVDEPTLRVPHPGMMHRSFVLRPLLDMEPHLTDPVSGGDLAARLQAIGGDATLLKLGTPNEVLGDCVAAPRT